MTAFQQTDMWERRRADHLYMLEFSSFLCHVYELVKEYLRRWEILLNSQQTGLRTLKFHPNGLSKPEDNDLSGVPGVHFLNAFHILYSWTIKKSFVKMYLRSPDGRSSNNALSKGTFSHSILKSEHCRALIQWDDMFPCDPHDPLI